MTYTWALEATDASIVVSDRFEQLLAEANTLNSNNIIISNPFYYLEANKYFEISLNFVTFASKTG